MGKYKVRRKISEWIYFPAVVVGIVLLVMAAMTLFWTLSKGNETPQVEVEPNNCYENTLKIVADIDYAPYTFYTEAGRASGHDVELAYLLADNLHYNTKVRLFSWSDAICAVENGSADMVLTYASTRDVPSTLITSIPYVSDPFIAFGITAFSNIGELYGKKIAVLENTGVIDDFLVPYGLMDNVVKYSSNSDAFTAVDAGECDLVIARYSVGRREIAQRGSKTKIQSVGPVLVNSYICIAVSSGNTQLLEKINSALISLSADGTLDKLSDKWLGSYVQTLTGAEFFEQNRDTLIFTVLILLLIIMAIYIFVRRKHVARDRVVLQAQAERDPLTGIYNRSVHEKRVTNILAECVYSREINALLLIDINNFKQINDTFGHMQGDTLLCSIADGLSKLFLSSDIVCRYGGDEFLVFLRNYGELAIVCKKANEILDLVRKTFSINGITRQVSASIGVALYPEDGLTQKELFAKADAALYEVKSHGKDSYALYGEIEKEIKKIG